MGGQPAWLAPVVFHSPFSAIDRSLVVRWYEATVQADGLATIVKALQGSVDSQILDVRLVSESGRFIVLHADKPPMDLASYGEGLQRVFEIGLLFAAHTGGIVLIDEFETAVHTRALGGFAAMTSTLAEAFDVQVFATTHSKETVDAFVSSEESAARVVAWGLYRGESGLTPRRYAGKYLKRAVDAVNLDIRRA